MKQDAEGGSTATMDCLKRRALEQIRQHRYAGHDETHTLRVLALSRRIARKERADLFVVEAAALLHDIGRGSEELDLNADHAEVSARIAEGILRDCQFWVEKIPNVLYAVRVHRFSQKNVPDTLEARILQDADRIDIGGAIGVAMTFAYGGAKNMELYDKDDPLARNRRLDDSKYVLDHFWTKLVRLRESMHTRTGAQLIRQRQRYLAKFMKQFMKEISLAD